MKLLFEALIKFLCGVAAVMLLLFLPCGSLEYTNGWLLCLLLFVPMLVMGVVLFVASPSLLKKRLDSKEKRGEQKGVVLVSGVGLLAGFIVAGLDFRFGWSHVPVPAVIAASVLFLLSYAMYAEVLRENEYLSRTVRVEEGQRVVDSGLYSIVRHPMYSAVILMFLSIPIVLGSLWSFLIFLHFPVVIVVRIIGEEKLLSAELAGYDEYKKKVKYRLIPFIW